MWLFPTTTQSLKGRKRIFWLFWEKGTIRESVGY